jgi:probable F420-dependent oxidoreductase
VEFGFSLPGRGPLARPDLLLKMALAAESLRYSSLFVTDHVVLPASAARSVYPYASSGKLPGGAAQDYLEPLSLLAYLAHATRRIKLGTSVLVIPYRNPLVTAKMLATIDVLSHGRLILGAGVGWLREEFEALAAPPFEARGPVTDEYLGLMRAVWTTDPVTFEGRHYSVRDVHALPKPTQKSGIPIWIGGHTAAAVRRAGALGDGWHPIALRPPGLLFPDEYAAKAELVRAAAREAGRSPDSVTLSVRVPMEIWPRGRQAPAGERPFFQGTAEEVAADIERYAAAGVTHFVFDHVSPNIAGVVANMKRFATDVRPKTGRTAATRHKATTRRNDATRTSTRPPTTQAEQAPLAPMTPRAPRTGHPRPKPSKRHPLQ